VVFLSVICSQASKIFNNNQVAALSNNNKCWWRGYVYNDLEPVGAPRYTYLLILLKWIQNDIIKWRETLRRRILGAPNEMHGADEQKVCFSGSLLQSVRMFLEIAAALGEENHNKCFQLRREPAECLLKIINTRMGVELDISALELN